VNFVFSVSAVSEASISTRILGPDPTTSEAYRVHPIVDLTKFWKGVGDAHIQPWRLGMLIFENFISRYENFKSRDSSSTRRLTWHSDWTTHLTRECCDTVDITPHSCGWAAAPGKCNDRVSCGGVWLQSAPVSRSRLFRPVARRLSSRAQQWTVQETDRLGPVYS